jgi:hypothetical protein
MDYMFTRTNALQLTTFLPDNNAAAKGLGLKGGFKPWFAKELPGLGTGIQARIGIDDWITNNPDLEADGEAFHDALPNGPSHPHDPIHERYVGAAYRMFSRGQARKAEALYNRWANNAGYAPITLISEAPPVVDAVDAIVGLEDGRVTCLLARP